jgi:hypothetical protein
MHYATLTSDNQNTLMKKILDTLSKDSFQHVQI